MSESQLPMWQRWAHFRFSVIGELLSCPPPKRQLQQAIGRLAQKQYRHPIDHNRWIGFGASTIERWYYKAKDADDPIAVLGRKIRSDAGVRWSMANAMLQALKAQYEMYPRWNVQLHYDNLKVVARKKPHLGTVPSYKTVLRCMRENHWTKTNGPAQPSDGRHRAVLRRQNREIRGFEVPYVHGLWHLDFHQAKIGIVDANGKWHRPIVLAVLDDHSRLCCHLQVYLNETAQCLVHGLSQAFMKRGLPRALMTDNGAAMLAEETRRGLKRLGIDHKTTLAYSPYQNGKQETFWARLESRLMELLRCISDLKLSFVNQSAQAWVEQDYHRTPHREIDTTPLERMLNGNNVARKAPDSDMLRLAFTRRLERKPRRSDATVTVDGVRYELPVRFARMTSVILRAPGWDISRVTLVDPNTDAPLARLFPQDKIKNASGMRRTVESASVSPVAADKKPLPELLKKWIADYAATGLPPAYLPMEEIDHE